MALLIAGEPWDGEPVSSSPRVTALRERPLFNNVPEIRKVQARGKPEKYLVAKTISDNDLLNQLQLGEAVGAG